MRLYRLLLPLFRALTQLFFAEIQIAGEANRPARGPAIVAANHPGSILDAILLATQVPSPVHYLARSGLFRPRPIAHLLHQLGAIPVYRRGEAGVTGDNTASFARVFELFEAGGCVGIFPEGRNSPDGRLGPLRSGTARIALAAEHRNDFALGLTIVPVGIALSARDFLLSAVAIRFAQPIPVAAYAERYRTDPDGAVTELTADLAAALRAASAEANDRELGELAGEIAALFGHELATGDDAKTTAGPPHGQSGALRRWFWRTLTWYRARQTGGGQTFDARVDGYHHIASVLSHAQAHDPEAIAGLRKRVERYKAHLGQTTLRRALESEPWETTLREHLPRLRMTAYALFAAPFALFGLIHNGVPYALTRVATSGFRDEPVRLFAGFGIGALVFAATYIAIGATLAQATTLSWPAIALYLIALPPTGLTALSYRRKLSVYRDKILLRTFFFTRGDLAALLQHERRGVLEHFQALADRYAAG